MPLPPFEMERWQSLHENRVAHNLSESGVHPFTWGELLELTGIDPAPVGLGYTQTNGTEALRERIAALHPGATPEQVLVTFGSAEANLLAVWELVSAGDRVAVLEPTYAQTPGLAAGLGAEVRAFRLQEDREWQPAPGACREAAGPGTRLIVVTDPNNPTGAVLAEEAVTEVLETAERTGAWILSDEVYAGAELSGERTPSLWGRHDRVVVTGSLSKAYGLPGLRLGWAVGPSELIGALWARKDYTTIAPAALSDALAAAVLAPETRARVLARTRGILRENLDLLVDWVAERGDAFSMVPPRAGAIAFLRYAMAENSTRLAERLRIEQDVLVVPGDHFGMDGYLRIGFGGPAEGLREALGRIGSLVDATAGATGG